MKAPAGAGDSVGFDGDGVGEEVGDGYGCFRVVRVSEPETRFAVGAGVGFGDHPGNEHFAEDAEVFFGREGLCGVGHEGRNSLRSGMFGCFQSWRCYDSHLVSAIMV